MQYRRVIGLAVPLLMQAAVAHATIDPITLQVMAVMNRWVAPIMVAAGFVGAGIVYFMSRDFERALITLGSLAIGGVLSSQIQPLVTFFFPG